MNCIGVKETIVVIDRVRLEPVVKRARSRTVYQIR